MLGFTEFTPAYSKIIILKAIQKNRIFWKNPVFVKIYAQKFMEPYLSFSDPQLL